VVPGGDIVERSCAMSGLFHHVPVICMSESTQWDEIRNPIKEWIKRRIVALFSSFAGRRNSPSCLYGGVGHARRSYLFGI